MKRRLYANNSGVLLKLIDNSTDFNVLNTAGLTTQEKR